MKTIVIYTSKRGSSKKYAEKFAHNNQYQLFEQNQLSSKELESVEKIYYFGSVYAGKVIGLAKLKEKVKENLKIIVVSVGLSSKNDHEKITEINKGITSIFPDAEMFHMRGQLSFKELSLPEKLIIKMIGKETKKVESKKMKDIEKAILQVLSDGSVNFLDLEEVKRIH